MSQNPPVPDDPHSDRFDAPDPGSGTPAFADRVPRRQLEQSVSLTGGERLRSQWYRLRLTLAEMNYATRRLYELQTSVIPDNHHHG
jgi:hypothetical protein